MKRRNFLAAVSGAAFAWPFGARAQGERRRRIGVLMGYAENDPEAERRLAAFLEGLRALNWQGGHNVDIDVRWAAGDAARAAAGARELIAFQPDVIVANTTPVTSAILKETRTIPIVFNVVSDPLGSGFVKSFAHPGANVTVSSIWNRRSSKNGGNC